MPLVEIDKLFRNGIVTTATYAVPKIVNIEEETNMVQMTPLVDERRMGFFRQEQIPLGIFAEQYFRNKWRGSY